MAVAAAEARRQHRGGDQLGGNDGSLARAGVGSGGSAVAVYAAARWIEFFLIPTSVPT